MTKIKGIINWFKELKEELWNPLSPETKNRLIGAYAAGEGAFFAAIISAFVSWPLPSWKHIFTTAAVTGFIATRNYLKQPNRTPYSNSISDGGPSNATGH